MFPDAKKFLDERRLMALGIEFEARKKELAVTAVGSAASKLKPTTASKTSVDSIRLMKRYELRYAFFQHSLVCERGAAID
jgi:hypothetical protein